MNGIRTLLATLILLCIPSLSPAVDIPAIDDEIDRLSWRVVTVVEFSAWDVVRQDAGKFNDAIGVLRGHRDVIVGWVVYGAPAEFLDLLELEIWQEMAALNDCFDFYQSGGRNPGDGTLDAP